MPNEALQPTAACTLVTRGLQPLQGAAAAELDRSAFYTTGTAMKCTHCKGEVEPYKCEASSCATWIFDECRVCHEEATHGKIRIQNIHICGSPTDYAGGEYDEDYEPDEDDKDAEWYENYFGGPDEDEEDEIAAELEGEEDEDYEYEEGGGIVTGVPLITPTGRRRYQNVCWNCTQAVDDESLPRCLMACGWVRCKCGSCLCNMPLHRRLERPHTVKIKYIPAAVRYCSRCRGVCFVPSDEERQRQQSAGQNYTPDPSQYSRCGECGGKGYLTT